MSDETGGALRKRVLSGIQPTGEVHLGNYLGALRQWVDMQDQYDCFYSIVDQHAILGDGDPATLPQRTVEMAVSLLSVGLDPENCTIFVQSDVPEHIELSWIFNVIAPVGDLERMTQYKDKSARYDSIPAGLLNYPILQAADILIYRAEAVPVGEDQKQHLELTRDIAKKFNNDFKCKDYFPIVEPLIPKEISRVMSLRDGKKKMSKSEDSDQSRINLKDNRDLIDQKIKKAKTDNDPIPSEINGLKNRYEAANLVSIYASINKTEVAEVLKEFGGKNFSTFKSKLSESIIEKICPIGNEINKLLKDKNYLDKILEKGAKRANLIAKNNLKEIYEIIGLTKFT